MTARLSGVDVWIFDLDNTLYPPSARLFDQIDANMRRFISAALSVSEDEADRLRAAYWREHGATLDGLVARHGVDPDAFLAAAHDIDVSHLAPDGALQAAIDRLPGRKLVHTNGSRAHAARVLAALELSDAFEAVFAIEDAGLTPKPRREAFDAVARAARVEPTSAAMIEDDPRNLAAPSEMGMATVWVREAAGGSTPRHVDVETTCLSALLTAVAQDRVLESGGG